MKPLSITVHHSEEKKEEEENPKRGRGRPNKTQRIQKSFINSVKEK